MLGMRGATIAGKVGYAASCLLAAVLLVVSGYAHKVDGLVTGLASSNAISGGAQTGAMNILLMGLESRTDYQGNTLSSALLTAMHAGSVYGVNNEGVGGQDTNTLILIHIFAGGQRAVGFSIPRDDWVTYPQPYDGQSQGKIDQAYGLAYAQSLNQTVSSSMSRSQRYFLANEAGQKATIDTVEAVTGQKIDHFAEVNLAGFFYLAQSFGGIEVCVNSWDGPQRPGHEPARRELGLQRAAGGLPAPGGRSGAGVRPGAGQPAQRGPGPHPPPAGGPRLRDLEAEDRGRADRRRPAHRPARHRRQVPHHRLELEPARLLDPDARAQRPEPEVLHRPHRGLRDRRRPGRQPDRRPHDPGGDQGEVHRPGAVGGRQARRSKPARKTAPIPAASTVTVDVYNGGSTGGLAGRVSAALVAKGYRPAPSPTRRRSRRPSRPANEVFYGAGRRPTPPRSPATSA